MKIHLLGLGFLGLMILVASCSSTAPTTAPAPATPEATPAPAVVAPASAPAPESQPAAAIVIKKAVYGDLPDGEKVDVTDKVTAMVSNGSTAIVAENDNFGIDPAPGVVKKLKIDYTIGGKDYSKTVNEHETLTLGAGGN